MRETYDLLQASASQPIVGLYDMGLDKANPLRLVDKNDLESDYEYYRYYRAAAFPVNTEVSRFTYHDGTITPSDMVMQTTVGVTFQHDYWDDLPVTMYSSSDMPSFYTIKPIELSRPETAIQIVTTENAFSYGEGLVDTILREQPMVSALVVGPEAIVDFLKGYIASCEADQPKRMAWRQVDYVLPRVDADLKRLMVTAHLAGIPADKLPIPEEHRYRVMVDLADTLAWYYTQHRSTLDDLRKPLEAYKDINDYHLMRLFSHPLDLVTRTIHRFEPTQVENIVTAYNIAVAELVEATQQLWYGHTYWYEKSHTVDDAALRTHFHRPPDPQWPKKFIAETSSEDLAYYSGIIETTVKAAADAKYFRQDTPPHN